MRPDPDPDHEPAVPRPPGPPRPPRRGRDGTETEGGRDLKPTPSQRRALARRDPALGQAMRRVPRFPGFPAEGRRSSHFQYLGRAIVFQQLAARAAETIFGRVCALTPRAGFPRPKELLSLSEAELRGAGLSRNKMLSLLDLARRVEDRSLVLPSIARRGDERIVEDLTAVRGIGEWTAQMFLLFRLGRLDVMPTTDLGVREGLRRLDGLDDRPAPGRVLERSEVWRPLRSVATWVLWRLTEVQDV